MVLMARSTAYQDKLKSSLISLKDAKQLQFEHHPTAPKQLKLPHPGEGFLIPYFDLTGKRIKNKWRYRYLVDTRDAIARQTAKKSLRYVGPSGEAPGAYYPPLVDWRAVIANTEQPVIITEGELKAACATLAGYPAIGLGGVWSFQAKKHHTTFLPELEEMTWDGRPVYIIFDSDARSNPDVAAARNKLAKRLGERRALVHSVDLPDLPEVQKVGLDDYVRERGIESLVALMEAAEPWQALQELYALNEEVVYVREPGYVLRVDNRQRLQPRAFVEHAYANRIYMEEIPTRDGEVKVVERSAAQQWLKWPGRAEVKKVVYEPGQPAFINNTFNTWKGWGLEPTTGDTKLWDQLLRHLFGNDREAQEWFENWLAYPLQYPGTKLYTSAVVWGSQHGTGKSLIGDTMLRIYGENGGVIRGRELVASHNEWAENKQFIVGDDVSGDDKRETADLLKAMITSEVLRINPKYISAFTMRDCINYYFSSNHPDAFYMEDTDRRMFIHEVRSSPMPRAFYDAYRTWYRGPGAAAVFGKMLERDVSAFDPTHPALLTSSKEEMLELGRSDLGSWVSALKSDPDSVLRMGNVVSRARLFTSAQLRAFYDPTDSKRVTSNGLSREMKRAGIERAYGGRQIPTSQGGLRLWIVRDTSELLAIDSPTVLGQIYDREHNHTTRMKIA